MDAMAVATEVARLLKEKGWTVRRLRDEHGFGTPAAVKLLNPTKGVAAAPSLDRALALVGKELWFRRRK